MPNTINVFGSIDVGGVLSEFRSRIVAPYTAGDPTQAFISDQNLITQLLDKASNPTRIGYTEYQTIPKYCRLISAKSSTIGYKITPEDIKNGYLTTTYNLSIRANNGDTIRWWGHTINPQAPTQAIISNIREHGGSHIQNLTNNVTSFYFASTPIDDNDLKKGLKSVTQYAFSLEATISANSGSTINYDVEILILSGPFFHNNSIMSVPIALLVVDPTIVIN